MVTGLGVIICHQPRDLITVFAYNKVPVTTAVFFLRQYRTSEFTYRMMYIYGHILYVVYEI